MFPFVIYSNVSKDITIKYYFNTSSYECNLKRSENNNMKEDEKMAQIPDALQAAPNVYKLLMENDRVRVLDVRVKPGEKTKMHSHPDRVVYILSDHRLKFTSADGQVKELELKAGQVLWMEAGAHTTENTGKTEAHNLAVELKECS